MSSSSLPSILTFQGNGGSYPPHGTITAIDHGPAVVVANWVLMCLMALSVIARFGTRYSARDKENITICIAALLATLQSVIIHLAVSHGLGRHRSHLSWADFAYYNKAVYASQILKILIYHLAKVSLVLVFIHLTPSVRLRRSLWLFLLFLTLWSGVAIITHGVQCPPPRWNISVSGCLNQGAIYRSYGVINILTDLIIVLIPLALLWKVQIGQSKKRPIYAVFVIRLVVCIASALELASLTEYLRNADKPWFIVDSTIWGQSSMNLSIITACIPSMKPLFNMLQFSLIDSSVAPPGPAKESTQLVAPFQNPIELKPLAHTSRTLQS